MLKFLKKAPLPRRFGKEGAGTIWGYTWFDLLFDKFLCCQQFALRHDLQELKPAGQYAGQQRLLCATWLASGIIKTNWWVCECDDGNESKVHQMVSRPLGPGLTKSGKGLFLTAIVLVFQVPRTKIPCCLISIVMSPLTSLSLALRNQLLFP